MGVIADILDAIIDTLDAAAIVEQVQGASMAANGVELLEAINTLPAIQVYIETDELDATTNVQQTTFGGGVQQSELVYNIDVYADQRSNIGDDMRILLPLIDSVRTLLRDERTPPYFGSTDIKQFHWTMQRVTFDYGGAPYIGARFVLTIRHF